jgi:hypothetical protein
VQGIENVHWPLPGPWQIGVILVERIPDDRNAAFLDTLDIVTVHEIQSLPFLNSGGMTNTVVREKHQMIFPHRAKGQSVPEHKGGSPFKSRTKEAGDFYRQCPVLCS